MVLRSQWMGGRGLHAFVIEGSTPRADMVQLETAVDAVRDRFGGASLTSAGSIGTDAGFNLNLIRA